MGQSHPFGKTWGRDSLAESLGHFPGGGECQRNNVMAGFEGIFFRCWVRVEQALAQKQFFFPRLHVQVGGLCPFLLQARP